ncbi:hypothetical protein ACP70R_049585 [Stipagrostis hirtigluma subsp. patula]
MASCYDHLCYHETQQNIKRWLLPLAIFFVVLAIVAIIIISFVVIPQIKANVADARLDTFAFVTAQGDRAVAMTTSFSYNISVALIVRNPNHAMSIRYIKPLVATILFHDRRLHNLTVVDEGHRHRPGKVEAHLLHAGGEVPSLLLGIAGAEDFKRQNATGLFNIEVRLSGEITHQGIVTARKPKLSLSCSLELQLAPPGPEVVDFQEVDCKAVKEDKIYF